jgi:chromosome segregation ATPase
MLTEAVVIALIGTLASVIAAVIASRQQARTTASGLYTELCKSQQGRIAQLVQQLDNNEREIRELQAALIQAQTAIAEIRGEKERLANRVTELERENTELRAQIEALQKRRGTKATGAGL